MRILAVIPARGGSRGIPRKNIKLMNGKPLITYTINNALKSKYITDVVVSTENEKIQNISQQYGAKVIKRPEELAGDIVTLDPVIYHATQEIEGSSGYKYDIIVTLQPTSPLLTVKTLDSALKEFLTSDYDCFISVTNKPCLSWRKLNQEFVPNYQERLNRQQLPDNFVETGAFVISRRNLIEQNSRINGKISVYEVPKSESIDIDDSNDWIICENLLKGMGKE